MQINSINQATSFNGIGINRSKMTYSQDVMASRLYRAIEGSSTYKALENTAVDILMLPNKHGGIVLKFLDRLSGMLIKNEKNNVPIQKTYKESDNVYEFADNIINRYQTVINPDYPKPKYQINDILQGKTYLAKINPKLNEKLVKEYNSVLALTSTPEYAEVLGVSDTLDGFQDYDF